MKRILIVGGGATGWLTASGIQISLIESAYYSFYIINTEELRLENGKNAYGLGSWASSLRYHDGVFYASTFSATTGRTHLYSTRDPERGPWKATSFEPLLGDHSLFFDDDGRVYMVYGGGRIEISELNPDLSGIKPGGVNKVIVEDVNAVFGTDQGGLKGGLAVFQDQRPLLPLQHRLARESLGAHRHHQPRRQDRRSLRESHRAR